MPGSRSEWLLTTINAVRDVMVERLSKHSLDAETERELQLALNMIEVMWEELIGQTDMLSLEHQRFQEFFEFAPDAYAITDAGCNVREANRALADLLKSVRADLLGKPLTRWVAESDQNLFLSKFVGLAAAPGSRALSWRTHLQPVQGEAIEVLVSVRTIPLRRSGVAGLCWLFRPA